MSRENALSLSYQFLECNQLISERKFSTIIQKLFPLSREIIGVCAAFLSQLAIPPGEKFHESFWK